MHHSLCKTFVHSYPQASKKHATLVFETEINSHPLEFKNHSSSTYERVNFSTMSPLQKLVSRKNTCTCVARLRHQDFFKIDV